MVKLFCNLLLLPLAIFFSGCATKPVPKLQTPDVSAVPSSQTTPVPAAFSILKTFYKITHTWEIQKKTSLPFYWEPTDEGKVSAVNAIKNGMAGSPYVPIVKNIKPNNLSSTSVATCTAKEPCVLEMWITKDGSQVKKVVYVTTGSVYVNPNQSDSKSRNKATGGSYLYSECWNSVYSFAIVKAYMEEFVQVSEVGTEGPGAPSREIAICHSGSSDVKSVCASTCTARVNGEKIAQISFDLNKDFHTKCEIFTKGETLKYLQSIGKPDWMKYFVYNHND